MRTTKAPGPAIAITPDDPVLHRRQAAFFKALGQPVRLALVRALADRPRCVCELTVVADRAMPTVSRHLEQLHRAGVVARHRQGTSIIYRLRTPCVIGFLDCLADLESGG